MPSAGPAFVAEIGPGPFYCGGRASSRARAFLHELLESYFDYIPEAAQQSEAGVHIIIGLTHAKVAS